MEGSTKPWTPADREAFISMGVNADHKGNQGPYYYLIKPKRGMLDNDDQKRSLFTETLSSVIHSKPVYKKIMLNFYSLLLNRIANNENIGEFLWKDIFVTLKGSNAYRYYVTDPEDLKVFKPSDMDVMVYINPYLEKSMFDELSQVVKTITLQTLSQYHRLLHLMFFGNKVVDHKFMTDQEIEQFKSDLTSAVDSMEYEGGHFSSPFKSDDIRNKSSKYSFLIKNSEVVENSIVKIDVPHFEKCERIPLRKSPFFCSYNDTIEFEREQEESAQGHFDLYRMRLNCIFQFDAEPVDADTEVVTPKMRYEKITADFIDVGIAYQNDAELISFWDFGRCTTVLDKDAEIWVSVPDIQTCIGDLEKMLTVYKCPEFKKEKRQLKYDILKKIARS